MDTPSPLLKRLRDHVRLAAACAFSAVAVLYAVLCLKLTADMSHIVCSVGYTAGCPRGLGPLALWALVAGLAAGGLWWSAVKGRGYRSAVGWLLAVAVALGALWPGWLGFSWLRGPHMDLFSYQVPDGPGADKPIGSWAGSPASGVVVRARADGVTGYDGEGRHGWSLRAPAGGAVCAMSGDTPSGTGLLTLTTAESTCGNRLVAVDVTSGEQRWTKDIPKLVGKPSAGGSLAVAATATAVLAHDLGTGAELWRSPLPAGAVAMEVAAGPDRVLLLARTDQGVELFALGARTGAVAWRFAMPVGYEEPPRIVSASPAAAVGDGRLLVFDDAGRPNAESQALYVPTTGETEWLVAGDVLYAAVPEREKREVLAAFSLKDGRHLWTRVFDDWRIRALAADRTGRIAVVTEGGYTHLWHLDPGTGKPLGESTVLRRLRLGKSFALYGKTFVNLDDNGRLPPIFDVTPAIGW
ncbi:PQQ-binding-like beta-propeller repeat protein [Streptomyces sp. NBC_01443]|uniref:outer membrane protein assembly factor BamB family protein n=1 Tax=Streptomyces sp. NBC_01443 TaxID=2903868 RepID=UPI00225998EC|nr:PQQ-binding-like beta-propeller repeat protein [Streptomyces sp. NBC_01443]MCX4629177.1 PQQ-binding-like beta-propeller repeat protein [Streptomyces sp. NBC_01443]